MTIKVTPDTWKFLSECTLSADESQKADYPIFVHGGFDHYYVQILANFADNEYIVNVKCIQSQKYTNRLLRHDSEETIVEKIRECISELVKKHDPEAEELAFQELDYQHEVGEEDYSSTEKYPCSDHSFNPVDFQKRED